MLQPATVTILPSQFPDQVRRDLLDSLRSRRINHKFHYDSLKQTQKWLALHAAFAPSRSDPDCAAVYDRSFAAAAEGVSAQAVHLIGLGCGGGQKDARLLSLLKKSGRDCAYTPSDVSVAMVLTARSTVLAALHEPLPHPSPLSSLGGSGEGEEIAGSLVQRAKSSGDSFAASRCYPLVCDLANETNLARALDSQTAPGAARIITFFGMIPNFEPDHILPRLAELLRPGDLLLFSANLALGPDYAAGVQRVLPQYDNDLTRDWLLTFLLDLGFERGDGDLRFAVADGAPGLKRITAEFILSRPRQIVVDGETIEFRPRESVRLFFSYRHTPATINSLLRAHRIKVLDQWITKSEEEAVFLCHSW